MKKSGLHKKIASIFDGGSPSCTGPAASAPADSGAASSVFNRLNGLDRQDTAAVAATGPVADPGVRTFETSTQVSLPAAEGRPMPLPKVKTAPKLRQTRVNWSEFQKRLFGPSGADPQQKKMAGLAGGLAVVFGIVLYFSFGGGVGGSKPSESAAKTKTEAALSPVLSGPVWVMPEELPETLRDPMKPLVAGAAVSMSSNPAHAANDPFVVKGIVFSQKRASALINDQIIGEGQEFDGIKVVRITKTEVEFEADGRRWTQPVRP
jgi:hypothetical protein